MSCDPNFGNVVLLLPFDGTNGQTTTTDVSSFANPVTINNGALSTASPQFGTAAFQTTGANLFSSYACAVPFAHASPLDIFAANGWTIEGWFNLNASGSPGAQLVDYGGSQTGGVTSDLIISAETDGATVTLSAYDYAAFGTAATISAVSTTGAAPGTWHHFALVNNAGTTTIYLDGVAGNSYINWTPSHYTATGITNVILGSTSRYNGPTTPAQIDEVRVSNIARYTANFTPPVAAFPTMSCTLTVPNVVGALDAAAQATIIAAHFTVGSITTIAGGTPSEVAAQSPVGGTIASFGSPVNLTEYTGGIVPDVVNTSYDVVAPTILAAAGFTVGAITFIADVLVIKGNVISQNPAAGSYATGGSGVNLVVSTGRGGIFVPYIIGDDVADATTAIETVGLAVNTISYQASLTYPAGEVIAQNPQGGTPVAYGSNVGFIVSTGPPVASDVFDFEATIISQYANSPTLLQLIASMNGYVDQAQNFANFYNFVWNVDTAQGFGLDIWGAIVNVSRLLQIPTSSRYVGFQDGSSTGPGPGWDVEPFSASGTWYSPLSATEAYLLDDDAYRQLILTKALANIVNTTVPAFNQLLQNLFPGRGNPYVVTAGPMVMTFIFDFDLTPIELAILQQSGAVPVPPGVSFTIVVP